MHHRRRRAAGWGAIEPEARWRFSYGKFLLYTLRAAQIWEHWHDNI